MSSFVFQDVRLFDGVAPDPVEAAHVLVEDGRIAEVSDRPIQASGAVAIACAGRTLMPGLIDAHYHANAADVDIAKLEAMPKSLINQYARLFLEASLQRGFTSIRDAGGADYGLAMAIESGLIRGPRLFYSGKALSQTGGHSDFRPLEQDPFCLCCQGSGVLGGVADGVAEVQRAARNELRKGASQIKIMGSGGVASPTDPIWNLQYSEEEIRAVVWEAKSWRTYVMAHAYTAEAIRRCVEYGVRSIEHANLIDREVAGFCTEQGAFVVPTLAAYDALGRRGKDLGFPQVSLDKLGIVREAGLESLEILKAAGTKVGFGTDLLGGLHVDQTVEFSIRAEVLTPFEVLKSATSVNAALLNREGELGCIAPGAWADLLVVDGDPLEDISLLAGQGEALALIMKAGHPVKNTLM